MDTIDWNRIEELNDMIYNDFIYDYERNRNEIDYALCTIINMFDDKGITVFKRNTFDLTNDMLKYEKEHKISQTIDLQRRMETINTIQTLI